AGEEVELSVAQNHRDAARVVGRVLIVRLVPVVAGRDLRGAFLLAEDQAVGREDLQLDLGSAALAGELERVAGDEELRLALEALPGVDERRADVLWQR